MASRALTPEQAARVYDRIGRLQDWQSLYEGPAIRDLLAHADLGSARAVVELGCGTGALAETLLDRHLPDDAAYCALDVSTTMLGLSAKRLARFGSRVSVRRVDGHPPLPGDGDSADRFLAVYVLDLMSEELTEALLAEAHRLLRPGGLLGLVSLAPATSGVSRLVCSAWNRLWERAPTLVGGCRPVQTRPLLDHRWQVDHDRRITAWGVTSQVLVATPLAGQARVR